MSGGAGVLEALVLRDEATGCLSIICGGSVIWREGQVYENAGQMLWVWPMLVTYYKAGGV